MAVFRDVPAYSSESSLPGTGRPALFNSQGARPGGPASFDWSIVFVDEDGGLMAGGSASIQWYGLELDGNNSNNVALGSAVAATPNVRKSISVGQSIWPWCRALSITPPSVSPKSIQVTITGTTDGDYQIAVVGEADPYVFPASGNSLAEITDGLVALFVGHDTLTVQAYGEGFVSLSSTEDFALEVSGPNEDSLDQSLTTPWHAQPVYLRISMTPAQPALDTAALVEAAASGAAQALTDGGVNTSGLRSAAYSAISLAVQDNLFPTPPSADAIAVAVDGDAWSQYGGNFASADTEIQMVSTNPAYRVAVLGWMASGDATRLTIELRSGDANAVNSALNAAAPALGTVGGGSAINLRPAKTPLWVGANGQGLVLKKSAGSLTCHCVVWYRFLPLA